MYATSYNQFSNRRRSTVIRAFGQYPIDVPSWRWQSYEVICFHHPDDQRLIFTWFNGWKYKDPVLTHHAMGVLYEVVKTVDHRGRVWDSRVETLHYASPTPTDRFPRWRSWVFRSDWKTVDKADDSLPPAHLFDWGALLSISRSIAAGRAEPLNFLGWIEDNLPEPWSLLATSEPVEAFRALSPIPLYPEGD